MSNVIVSSGVTSTGVVLQGTLYNPACMYVLSAGTANSTTVNSNGSVFISSGGTAEKISAYNGGTVCVYQGGRLDQGAILGGSMCIGGLKKDGTLTNVFADASRLAVQYGSMTVVNGGRTFRTSTFLRGFLDVSSGGTATYASAYSSGVIHVSSGGKLISAWASGGASLSVTHSGQIFVYSGGQASNTDLYCGGEMFLMQGTASETLVSGVNDYGKFNQRYTLNFNGILRVSSGGTALDTQVSRGLVEISKGGLCSVTAIKSGGLMRVREGGLAVSTNVGVNGSMYVYYGGCASNTTIGGTMLLLSNGKAVNTTIHTGCLTVSKGAVVTGILTINGGAVKFYENAIFNFDLTEKKNSPLISNWSLLNGRDVADYYLTVDANNKTGTYVLAQGASDFTEELIVYSGKEKMGTLGLNQSITVNGKTYSLSRSSGSLNVSVTSGDTPMITYPDLSIATFTVSSASITTSQSLTVKFTVKNGGAALAPASTAWLYDGTTKLASVAVSALAAGNTSTTYSYMIAAGKMTAGSHNLKIVADGADTIVESNEYNNSMSRTITISGSVNSAKSDVDGNNISDVMFQYTGGDYQIGFWMNGTSTWQGTGASQPANWELLGAYDMDSSGMADQVMFGNVLGGAYIGYYKDGDTTDDGWTTIGYLNNPDEIKWDNVIGNLTGNAGQNSIVWHAAELNACGVWTDGTTDWVSISGNFDASWSLQGCGDFTGDGKDEVLWQHAGALYTTDINSNFASLGDGWGEEWQVRAIGDFSGDWTDDIILFHEGTGSVVKLANGQSSDWESLGQLDTSDWFIVGSGDYDNDQQDDLLVRQYSTGMLGYYSAGDMSKWHEMGRGVDMNWTVIA